MSGKGSISRMSDECLMKGKSGMPYFYEYQAGTRKFTLAGKSETPNVCNTILAEYNPTPSVTSIRKYIYTVFLTRRLLFD